MRLLMTMPVYVRPRVESDVPLIAVPVDVVVAAAVAGAALGFALVAVFGWSLMVLPQ
jgi:hypothetical protein